MEVIFNKIDLKSIFFSLISHLQISHKNEMSNFQLSIENFERLKTMVPRNTVSIIRPGKI